MQVHVQSIIQMFLNFTLKVLLISPLLHFRIELSMCYVVLHVCDHVRIQVTPVHKTPATYGTLVRFLSGMNAHVQGPITLAGQKLAANITRKSCCRFKLD